MENLCDLYFEFSNEDRLRILYLLKKEPMKLTGVAGKIGFSNQECSRHLSRLVDVGLVEKNVDGSYVLTEFGSLVLQMQPPLRFITENKAYFTSHTLSGVPGTLLCRLGELGDVTVVDSLTLAQFMIGKIIRESEEQLYETSDQYMVSTFHDRSEALRRGVRLRTLDTADMVLPSQVREWYRSKPEYTSPGNEARGRGQVQERITEGSGFILHMSEKEAFLAFPLVGGGYDYQGFASEGETFRGWCLELFEHSWRKAETRVKAIRDLFFWVRENREAAKGFLGFAEGEQIPDDVASKLAEKSLIKDRDLTVMGEVVYRILAKKVKPSAIDFDRYWDYLYDE